MAIFGLVLLSFGFFGIACGSECVPETAKCSKYWVKIEPHKNLMESENELDHWCKKQSKFYECLESVLLAGKNGNMSYLPTNLLISKLFAEDLCTEGSKSRGRYLNNAFCINQMNTEFCTEPEYLDIVTADEAIPPSRCSLSEKSFSCIAATMVLNCGFDAGRVYRNLLKITRYSDEVCDIEASKGIPPCEDPETRDDNRDEKLSGLYYGLVHRIGTIPEQDASLSDSNDVTEPPSSQEMDTGDAELSNSNDVTEQSTEKTATEGIEAILDFISRGDVSEETISNLNEVIESQSTEDTAAEGIQAILDFIDQNEMPEDIEEHPERTGFENEKDYVNDATESTATTDASDIPEVTADDVIALVFSGDESRADISRVPVQEVGYQAESAYVSDQAVEHDLQSESDPDPSAVPVLILNEVSAVDSGNSDYGPEIVYAINSMEVLDNDQISELTESSDAEYGILKDDIVLLQSVPDGVVSEYAIVNSSGEVHRIGMVTDQDFQLDEANVSEVMEPEETGEDDVIAEAIQSALDFLEENTISEEA